MEAWGIPVIQRLAVRMTRTGNATWADRGTSTQQEDSCPCAALPWHWVFVHPVADSSDQAEWKPEQESRYCNTWGIIVIDRIHGR